MPPCFPLESVIYILQHEINSFTARVAQLAAVV